MARFRRLPAAVVALALVGGLRAAPAEAIGVELDAPVALPAFELEDHHGREFTRESLAGRWHLLLAGFTHCPDVCPFTLANLQRVMAELSLRTMPDKLPRVLFLAVDPKRDRPVLRDYVEHFHPDFLGVTGDEAAVDALVAALDGLVRRGEPDAQGDYEVAHSAAVSVIDPQARVVARLNPPLAPPETAAYLSRLMRAAEQAAKAEETKP